MWKIYIPCSIFGNSLKMYFREINLEIKKEEDMGFGNDVYDAGWLRYSISGESSGTDPESNL